MDPKEKKEMAQLVGEVIDQKVSPRLEKIEKKQSEHDEKLDAIMEQVATNSVDITEMKEDVSDTKNTQERIETRLNSVVRNQDDINDKSRQLNRRVLRLEAKKV